MTTDTPLYIFWAHSPIGYETYLTLKEIGLLTNQNSGLITARMCTPPEAITCIGLPEEYIWQTPEEFAIAQQKIVEFLKMVNPLGKKFELIAPQSANFFVRCLIESEYCDRYIFFDEGDAAYEPFFKIFSDESNHFYQYHLRTEPELEPFFKFLGIKTGIIRELYEHGVPFYCIQHAKFAGFISYFQGSFPGCHKELIPIPTASMSATKEICKEYGLIVLPEFRTLSRDPQYSKKLELIVKSTRAIVKLSADTKWVVKFHPHDNQEMRNKIIAVFPYLIFETFCERRNISKYREPAFMGFHTYVSSANSTITFLNNIGGNYLALST